MSVTDWLTLALVILTGALAIITGFYAWATFCILEANKAAVQAMRQQTEAQLRPYVVVAPTVRIGTTLLCLEVQIRNG
jgi:CBS domain containing-hemolysin-like protein